MTTPIRKYYREIFIVIAGVVGFILYVNYQNHDCKMLWNIVKQESRHNNRVFTPISDSFVIIIPECLLRDSQAQQSGFYPDQGVFKNTVNMEFVPE